jgi:hypothetical protein
VHDPESGMADFWRNQTFNPTIVNLCLWVARRRIAKIPRNGRLGFAPLERLTATPLQVALQEMPLTAPRAVCSSRPQFGNWIVVLAAALL